MEGQFAIINEANLVQSNQALLQANQLKSANEINLYNAWQKAEKDKIELQQMLQQTQQQILILREEINELKKHQPIITNSSNDLQQTSNDPLQTAYHTDEEELENETGWMVQTRKNKRKKVNTPSPEISLDRGKMNSDKPIPGRALKPPPVIIDKNENFEEIYKILIDNGLEVKSKLMPSKDIKINIKDGNEYRVLTNILNETGKKWHSYENKLDRPIRVIAKGIIPCFSNEQIKEDLKKRRYKIMQAENIIKKLNVNNKKTITKFPVHMLTFSKDENVKKIYEIRDILGMRVQIEPIKKPQLIPQCKRCQEFGHTKTYCRKTPKCVRCAEDHLTEDCDKPRTNNAPKCANCKNQHPANYRGCEVAKALQKIRDQGNKSKKTTRTNATVQQKPQQPKPQTNENPIVQRTSTNQVNTVIDNSNNGNVNKEQQLNNTVEAMLLSIIIRLDKQESNQENFKKEVMIRLAKLETSNKKAGSRKQ